MLHTGKRGRRYLAFQFGTWQKFARWEAETGWAERCEWDFLSSCAQFGLKWNQMSRRGWQLKNKLQNILYVDLGDRKFVKVWLSSVKYKAMIHY